MSLPQQINSIVEQMPHQRQMLVLEVVKSMTSPEPVMTPHDEYICRELKKAESYAASPDAVRISSDEFFKQAWELVEAKESENVGR